MCVTLNYSNNASYDVSSSIDFFKSGLGAILLSSIRKDFATVCLDRWHPRTAVIISVEERLSLRYPCPKCQSLATSVRWLSTGAALDYFPRSDSWPPWWILQSPSPRRRALITGPRTMITLWCLGLTKASWQAHSRAWRSWVVSAFILSCIWWYSDSLAIVGHP